MEDANKNQAISALLKKLADPDPDARQDALKEALLVPDMKVLESVKQLLADPNPAVRYYAKKCFGSISAQISARAMVENEEKKAATQAAEKAQEGNPDFISSAAREKINAIQAVPDTRDPIKAEVLIEELGTAGDRFVIATIIKKLGKVGGKETAAHIVPFLSHEDNRVIANAVEALDGIGDEEGVLATLKLLSHEDNRVKGNITKILYKYLEKDRVSKSLIMDKLTNMLNSREPWTQDSAIYALGAIGNEAALDILSGFRGHADGAIKSKLAETVTRLKKKLDPNFEEKERGAKWAAESAIGGIDSAVKASQRVITPEQAEKMNDGVRRVIETVWVPDAPLSSNVMRAAAAAVAGISLLFVATAASLTVYYLAFGLPAGTREAPDAAAARPSSGEERTDEAIRGLVAAEKFGQALEIAKAAGGGKIASDAGRAAADLVHSKKVEGLVADGRNEDALRAIAEWQGDNSASTLACILKGNIELSALGKPADARASFGLALALEPGNFEAKLGMADCAYAEKRYDEAIKLYLESRQAARARGGSLSAHLATFGLANCKAAKGDRSGAEEAFGECLSMRADHTPARLGLARTLRLSKKYDRAAAEIEKVMAQNPETGRADYEMAELLNETGKTSDAMRYYLSAMRKDPSNSAFRVAYINLLFRLQIFQGTDDLIKAEIAAGNKNHEIYEKLGVTQYSLHRSAEAKETFEKMISIEGDGDTACYYLGLLNEEIERFDEAIDLYKRALNANNKHLPSYLNLSNVYLNSKRDYNQVEIITELGITNCGNHPGLLYNKALASLYQKNTAQALILLKAVMNSDDPFMANEAKKLEADIRARSQQAAPAGQQTRQRAPAPTPK